MPERAVQRMGAVRRDRRSSGRGREKDGDPMSLRYVISRLLQTAGTLLLMSLIVFAALRLIPGDAAIVQLGEFYSKTEAELLRHQMGLDRPFFVQYGTWLWGAIRGDFGVSMRSHQPIGIELSRRVPVTLQISLLALLMSLAIGIPAGILSAAKRGTFLDGFVRVLSLIGISLPHFWVGLMFILVFALMLRWVPSGGYVSLASGIGPYIRSMAGPVLVLGTAMAASTMRITRASMLEVLGQDYIRTGRAKGLREGKVITLHAFKNALIPILTVIGVQFGFLLAGSVAVETVFTLPGMSRYAVTGVSTRDYPVVMATVMIISMWFMVVNLIVDLLYAFIDPRIRYD
jgi:peptide/nickel transport system permease protein